MLQRSIVLICVLLVSLSIACSGGKTNETRPATGASQPQETRTQASAEQPPSPQAEPAPESQSAPAKVESRPAAGSSAARTKAELAPKRTAPAGEPEVHANANPKAIAPVESSAKPAAGIPEAGPPVLPKPIRIASGTRLDVRLIDAISSETNKDGDGFRATLNSNLEVDGKVVAARGSLVAGKCTGVKSSGRVEGVATLSIALTKIEIAGVSYPLQTDTLKYEAEKTIKEDAKKVGIGAGVGAIIGAIAGGGKGAAIGAAVGGGAGTAAVLVTKGKEVSFGAEERFNFVLKSDLEIKP